VLTTRSKRNQSEPRLKELPGGLAAGVGIKIAGDFSYNLTIRGVMGKRVPREVGGETDS
jgi:hypothetical protein